MALTFNSVDPRTGEPGPSFAGGDAGGRARRGRRRRGRAPVRRAARPRPPLRPAARRRRAPARGRRRDRGRLRARDRSARGPPAVRARAHLRASSRRSRRSSTTGDDAEAIIDHPDPDAVPIPKPDVRRMLVPLGPVAVFGASNFPLAFSTAGGDTASALAAGCPVVVKGHPSHPGTGEMVARELRAAVAAAGLPDGTFANLPAAGVEVGEALVDAPEIAAVGFTGSFAGGKAIYDRAGRRACRSRCTPRWARSTRSWSPRGRARAGRDRSPRASPHRCPTSAGSCARSLAWCSSRPGRTATRSPPTSRRGWTACRRPCCSTSACATRCAALSTASPRGRRCAGSAARRAADGPGFRHQPAAYEAPAGARPRRRAAGGALRPGRAAAAPRLARGAAGRAAQLDGQLTGSCTPSRARTSPTSSKRSPTRRARRVQRLPDRRRGHPRHAPRRPVPGDHERRCTRRSA